MAEIFRLESVDFEHLVTKHRIEDFCPDDLEPMPASVYAVEINFSSKKIASPLPGGYSVPGDPPSNPSSRRISLIVRLNFNRLRDFLLDTGSLSGNDDPRWPREEYSRGGVLFVPIAYLDGISMWVAAYGCVLLSATPLPAETPQDLLARQILEARYTEHCTEPASSRESPIPYRHVLTMPEVRENIPNPDHLNEMLVADCNDEFVIGSHFLYAKLRRQLVVERKERFNDRSVNFATILL